MFRQPQVIGRGGGGEGLQGARVVGHRGLRGADHRGGAREREGRAGQGRAQRLAPPASAVSAAMLHETSTGTVQLRSKVAALAEEQLGRSVGDATAVGRSGGRGRCKYARTSRFRGCARRGGGRSDLVPPTGPTLGAGREGESGGRARSGRGAGRADPPAGERRRPGGEPGGGAGALGAVPSAHGTGSAARRSATAGAVEWGSRSRGSEGRTTSTSTSSQKRYGRCSR